MTQFADKLKGLLQNAATAPKLLENLHPTDVGAAIGRPRATIRRPYGFERQNIGILQQIHFAYF